MYKRTYLVFGSPCNPGAVVRSNPAAVSSWTACWSMCFNKPRRAGWCVAKHLSGLSLPTRFQRNLPWEMMSMKDVVCCWTMLCHTVQPVVVVSFLNKLLTALQARVVLLSYFGRLDTRNTTQQWLQGLHGHEDTGDIERHWSLHDQKELPRCSFLITIRTMYHCRRTWWRLCRWWCWVAISCPSPETTLWTERCRVCRMIRYI